MATIVETFKPAVTKVVEISPAKSTYTLTLSEKEAQWLKAISKHIGGDCLIHNAMCVALSNVPSGDYETRFIGNHTLWVNGPKDE